MFIQQLSVLYRYVCTCWVGVLDSLELLLCLSLVLLKDEGGAANRTFLLRERIKSSA